MRLKRGRGRYQIPPVHRILSVTVTVEGKTLACIKVTRLNPANVVRAGIPVTFMVKDREIAFWPVPDKDYYATVTFLPPVQEF